MSSAKNMQWSIAHTYDECYKLRIAVPTTVTKGVIRCNDKGDTYANAVCGKGGGYDKLASAFEKISKYCDDAYNNPMFKSKGTKKDLKQAKTKADAAAAAAKAIKEELSKAYALTADIAANVDRD